MKRIPFKSLAVFVAAASFFILACPLSARAEDCNFVVETMKATWKPGTNCMRDGIYSFAVNSVTDIACSRSVHTAGASKPGCEEAFTSCKTNVEKAVWEYVTAKEGCRSATADECYTATGEGPIGIKDPPGGPVSKYLSCNLDDLMSWKNVCEMVKNSQPPSSLPSYDGNDQKFSDEINRIERGLLWSCLDFKLINRPTPVELLDVAPMEAPSKAPPKRGLLELFRK